MLIDRVPDDQGKLVDYLAANREVVRTLPAILAKRREVQALRRRPDREILSGGFMNMRADLAGGPLMQTACRVLNRFFNAYWSCARLLIASDRPSRPPAPARQLGIRAQDPIDCRLE